MSLPSADNIQRVVLDNGLRVLVRENHSAPVAVVDGYLPVGSVHDPADRAGLSSFAAHMLTRGSRRFDYATFNEMVESAGANLTASGDVHTLNFSATGLSEDFPMLLEVLADALRRPTFEQTHVDLVQTQKQIGFQERAQDTQRMAALRCAETLFPAHPYGRAVSGYPESVAAITRDELAAFHAVHYTPHGAVLVVTGAVSAAQALDLVERCLGDWRGPRPNLAAPPLPAVGSRRVVVPMPGKVQADIVVGCPAAARSDPDFYAVRVANTVLGQFGLMGRLGEVVREEQGLAYYAYTTHDADLDGGAWFAYAGVNPEDVELAESSILAQLDRLAAEPVSAEELADSQAYLTGVLPLTLETNEGVASTLLNMEWFGLGLDYLLHYREAIYAVTPADVQRVAQRYLAGPRVVCVAGPQAPGE